MEATIISGIIGGIIAAILVPYIIRRSRQSSIDGLLVFGDIILAIGCVCLAFVVLSMLAFFYDADAWEKTSELFSIIGIFVGFGACAYYLLSEYFVTSGEFDQDGITFRTPWSGSKKEKWDDLVTAKFNPTHGWYVLGFRNGVIIRLSPLLLGHRGVLKLLKHRGVDVQGAPE